MFTGFSDATIDFLWELRFHNERPWFLEHKQVFLDTLDRPMKALAADVTAALDADPLPLTELAERLNAQDTFALAGQDYVRPKGNPGALLSPWYNKRVLDLSCVRAHDDLLFSPALTDELVRGFGFLLPYYDYLEAVTRRKDA